MKTCLVSCLLVAAHGATPLSKVLEMLGGMIKKGEAEKHDEQVRFSAFSEFCKNTARERQESIKVANQNIVSLNADIEQDAAKAETLGNQIAALSSQIGLWENDMKVAKGIRKQENADFQATHDDYSESLSAIQRAVTVLQQQNYDREQAEKALMQVSGSKRVPASSRAVLTSFLQEPPQANAYEFQSGGVIDMLKELQIKFRAERDDLKKEEMNKKFAFENMMQDLTNELKNANEDLDSKTILRSKTLNHQAQCQSDLEFTQRGKAEDQKYLSDLTAECSTKSAEYEVRQKTRTDELAAINAAIGVLSSDDVAGNAGKHLPKLMQTSFLQHKAVRGNIAAQRRVTEFLQGAADKLKSQTLVLAALRASEDPFNKVKKMIADLIIKLKEEATAETEKKGWCNTEVSANKQTRGFLNSNIEELNAEIEKLSAKSSKLKEQKAILSKEIAELNAAMAEATSIRQAEASANRETIADAKAGQGGVATAIQILKEFYASAAEKTAFVQGAVEDLPASWDAPYKGMQGENGGVIGMLEVLESDFARLEAETKANEDSSAREYKTFMNESDEDKAVKQTNLDNASVAFDRTQSALHASNKDLSGNQEELQAALDVFEKLKPQCLDNGLSYEERVQKRKDEVESLKEALRILAGDA